MDNNKIQKLVGAGSVVGLLLIIAMLFSNGTFSTEASTTSTAALDSETIMQMDESAEMEAEEQMENEEGEDYDEMDEDEDYEDEDYDDDEMDEDEMDEDEDDDEGGILGFDFEFGLFGEKD